MHKDQSHTDQIGQTGNGVLKAQRGRRRWFYAYDFCIVYFKEKIKFPERYIFTVHLYRNTDTILECSFTDLHPPIHAILHITYNSLPLKPTSIEPKHM